MEKTLKNTSDQRALYKFLIRMQTHAKLGRDLDNIKMKDQNDAKII